MNDHTAFRAVSNQLLSASNRLTAQEHAEHAYSPVRSLYIPTKDDMTKQQAAHLQQEWVSMGNPDCRHDMLKLLMSEDGTYLTGEYGCAACGAQIPVGLE